MTDRSPGAPFDEERPSALQQRVRRAQVASAHVSGPPRVRGVRPVSSQRPGAQGSRPAGAQARSTRPAPGARVRAGAVASSGPYYANIGWRAWTIIAVAIICLLVIVPAYVTLMTQRQQISALAQSNAMAQQNYEDLTGQLARWDDPSFISTQARSRLQYVMPGEIPYRIIDSQGRLIADPSQAVAQIADAKVPEAWYQKMWVSVQGADAAPRAISLVPEKSP